VSRVRVALATKNPGKVREIATILAGVPIELVGPDPGWVPPPEDGETYTDNARIKVRSLVSFSGMTCVADDSGIEVDALDGAPGAARPFARAARGTGVLRCC
jgi:XTP/dITP diphosphohydrolase